MRERGVWALQKFRRLLIGRAFVVRTDHTSLQWLMKAEQPKIRHLQDKDEYLARSCKTKQCEEKEGVWYYQGRLFVPASLKDEILLALWCVSTPRRKMVCKTLTKLKERHLWTSINKDVHQMCRNCLTCQRRAQCNKKKRYDIGSLNAKWVFDTVALHLIGPISYWNKTYFALTMMDHAPKWQRLQSLRTLPQKWLLTLLFMCGYNDMVSGGECSQRSELR